MIVAGSIARNNGTVSKTTYIKALYLHHPIPPLSCQTQGYKEIARMNLEHVHYLTSEKLANLCRENTDLYMRDQAASDSRYCYELIRRAIFRIENADKLFDEVYRPLLERKIYLLCKRQQLVADLTQEALMRFFRYITPETWQKFPTLGHVLSYLSKCGEAAVLNYYRKASPQKEDDEVVLENGYWDGKMVSKRPIEHDFEQRQVHQRIWECVQRNCKDAEDHLLAEQLWLYEAKPQVIVERFADKFPHISDVYKRKRNLLDRIKRDRECQALVTS